MELPNNTYYYHFYYRHLYYYSYYFYSFYYTTSGTKYTFSTIRYFYTFMVEPYPHINSPIAATEPAE